MSLLRILAAANENTPLRWVRLDRHYEIQGSGGESNLERQETDTRIELIVPAERSSLIPVKVSPEQLSRLSDDNLQWLVEPYVSQDLGQLHLVRGEVDADEILTVYTVDRDWLTTTVRTLADRQIRPDRILLELLLTEWRPQTWSIVIKPGGGFVRTGEHSALILDRQNGDAPPLVLQMAMRDLPAPTEILIYHATETSAGNFANWSTALGVPIRLAGIADWQQAHPKKTLDLARGPFSPLGQARNLARRLKLSGWLLLGIIVVNVLGTGTRTVLNILEKQRLENQIESVLLKAFPGTTAILDPLLQMQKSLDQMTRAAGITTGNDFLPLLEKIKNVIGKQFSGKINAVSFEADKWMDLTLADAAQARQAADLLKAAGFAVEMEAATAPNAMRVRVRITP